MSLLWNSIQKNISKKKLITSHKRPSPKDIIHSTNPARGLLPYIIDFRDAIKGTPLSAFLAHTLSAGMTVEASIVLPLFLFFFLNLSSAIEMIRLHGNLQLALWDIGNRMAVCGYVLPKEKEIEESAEWWKQAAGIAFSYLYVKEQIGDFLGKPYLEEAPIVDGINGLQFWESDISTEGDVFEITVTYQISSYCDIAAFRPFRMANRYYGHLWNGYELSTESDENEDIVYITERGKVYHRDIDCSHIKLSIQETTLQDALKRHNSYGERYQLCDLCGKKENSTLKKEEGATVVWITLDGNGVHYNRNCSGLKRTIREVPLSETAGYLPCSRCGK